MQYVAGTKVLATFLVKGKHGKIYFKFEAISGGGHKWVMASYGDGNLVGPYNVKPATTDAELVEYAWSLAQERVDGGRFRFGEFQPIKGAKVEQLPAMRGIQ